MDNKIKEFMDSKVLAYDHRTFIKDDPVSIPHLFKKKQDIEIAGFFAAVFAWGNRTTIIRKSLELLERMDNAPYDFVTGHRDTDLKRLLGFKHRTFNDTDLLYFMAFLQQHYWKKDTLEEAFTRSMRPSDLTVENALNGFYDYFFSLEAVPTRTRKHIAAPKKRSGCKRLNMYLRWMVRADRNQVDFGIWKKIRPSQLVCPIDLHVARVAKRFGLLKAAASDWTSACQLTEILKKWDPADPVKYDFALFGLGVMEKF